MFAQSTQVTKLSLVLNSFSSVFNFNFTCSGACISAGSYSTVSVTVSYLLSILVLRRSNFVNADLMLFLMVKSCRLGRSTLMALSACVNSSSHEAYCIWGCVALLLVNFSFVFGQGRDMCFWAF